MDPFVGQINMVGFNFAPVNWAFCNGQIMNISQNQALFALLGTTYGGNGTQTFALPNLQSRVPVGMGQGTGLSTYVLGQVGGSEQMQTHNHTAVLNCSTAKATDNAPHAGWVIGLGDDGSTKGSIPQIYSPTPNTATVPLGASSVAVAQSGTGGSGNIQPYLAINYIIALAGIFPSRS